MIEHLFELFECIMMQHVSSHMLTQQRAQYILAQHALCLVGPKCGLSCMGTGIYQLRAVFRVPSVY